MKAIVIGGASYDHIIQLGEIPKGPCEAVFSKQSYFMVGGTGSGKALNLCRLGFDITFHCRVGNDEPGRAIQSFFNDQPLKLLADIDKESTECHTNLMDDHGGRTSIYTDYLEFDPKLNLEPVLNAAQECDAVVVNIMNYCRQYLPQLKEWKCPIWVDIHDFDGVNQYHEDFIDSADYLFMSSEQMPDFRNFMVKQIQNGKELIVCTHGKKGATCLTKEGHWYEQPIIEGFERKDTNGAGDAFMSGFMFGYLTQQPIQRCLEFGAIAAGMAITQPQLFHSDLSPQQLTAISSI